MASTSEQPIRFGFCLPVFASPGNIRFRTPNYQQLMDVPQQDGLKLFAEQVMPKFR